MSQNWKNIVPKKSVSALFSLFHSNSASTLPSTQPNENTNLTPQAIYRKYKSLRHLTNILLLSNKSPSYLMRRIEDTTATNEYLTTHAGVSGIQPRLSSSVSQAIERGQDRVTSANIY